MSLPSPTTLPFQTIFRLVSPTVNVKHGALSANSKFATNIPLGWGAFIYEVEWGVAIKDVPVVSTDWQVTMELTENQVLTSASNTDALLIDDSFFEERIGTGGATITNHSPFQETRRRYLQEFGGTYPSVAVNWNVIATMVEIVGSGPATNGVDVFANIWYTLAPVTADLSAYLTKRQQLQR